jgi:ribose-phosphate pyrophosphokinase
MSSETFKNVKLIAGRSNLALAEKVSKLLEIPLTKTEIRDFANTEIGVKILENVRGMHVFIIQTGSADEEHSINDYIVELYELIHACKLSSATSINIIVPCYPYARSDKKDAPRVSIMSSMIASTLQFLGVARIVSMDLHAGQIQGFFQGPFDNLYAINHIINYLKTIVFNNLTIDEINQKFVLVAPDIGAVKRIEAYARELKMKHVIMHKHRNYDKPGTVINSILIGDKTYVENRTAIIIDDIFDSFGTINAATMEMSKYGVKSVIAISTHGIFSGTAFDKINSNPLIEKVVVTNTLPQESNLQKTNKLVVLDVSDILAVVIKTLVTGGSISELFIK